MLKSSTLCEWHSAGLHAALQPAWHLAENQWGHSCVGGLPGGIIWFSSNTLWNRLAKQDGRQPCACEGRFQLGMWLSARPGKGFTVNMPGLSTGCRINAACTIRLRNGVHTQITVISHSRLVMWGFFKARGANTNTNKTLWNKLELNFSMLVKGTSFCILNYSTSPRSTKKKKKELMNMSHLCVLPRGCWNGTQPVHPEGSSGKCQVCRGCLLCRLWIHLKSAWPWFFFFCMCSSWTCPFQGLRHFKLAMKWRGNFLP